MTHTLQLTFPKQEWANTIRIVYQYHKRHCFAPPAPLSKLMQSMSRHLHQQTPPRILRRSLWHLGSMLSGGPSPEGLHHLHCLHYLYHLHHLHHLHCGKFPTNGRRITDLQASAEADSQSNQKTLNVLDANSSPSLKPLQHRHHEKGGCRSTAGSSRKRFVKAMIRHEQRKQGPRPPHRGTWAASRSPAPKQHVQTTLSHEKSRSERCSHSSSQAGGSSGKSTQRPGAKRLPVHHFYTGCECRHHPKQSRSMKNKACHLNEQKSSSSEKNANW